jgi:hypothetical protein
MIRQQEYQREWRRKNKAKRAEYARTYYLNNRAKLSARMSEWRKKHAQEVRRKQRAKRAADPAKMRRAARAYYRKNSARILQLMGISRRANPERARAQAKRYRARHRDKINAYLRARYKRRAQADPQFKLRGLLRTRLSQAVRRQYGKKAAGTMELIGCSVAELRVHLEKQFLPGMSWKNHSLGGWHIDHKNPCCTYDLTKPDQQRECFHFTNLRPLWAFENQSRPDVRS